MAKEAKTNAMRILEKKGIAFTSNTYQCDEFIDGVHIADMLGQSYDESFKTIVTIGKSRNYYVFVLPVDKELDLKKCAKAAKEKSLETLHVKDLLATTGYVRGGCTAIGMKKAFPVFIHESCMEHEKIIISGGRIGLQLILSPQDFLAAAAAECADIIAE